MLATSETHQVGQVPSRVRLRFPEVPAERVDALVRQEYAAITGPIRSYVPILVEKAVLARLRGETAGQATFTLSAGPG